MTARASHRQADILRAARALTKLGLVPSVELLPCGTVRVVPVSGAPAAAAGAPRDTLAEKIERGQW